MSETKLKLIAKKKSTAPKAPEQTLTFAQTEQRLCTLELLRLYHSRNVNEMLSCTVNEAWRRLPVVMLELGGLVDQWRKSERGKVA